ncbi:MAG: hypothetical protein HY782_20165 [Chloroflexi bacterium]|nr:hypothetical protein [Chloroflexota bacterium]
MATRRSKRSQPKKTRKATPYPTRGGESLENRTLKKHEDEFRGKNVIVIGTEIHPIKNGKQAARLLEELRRKYPKRTPLLTYVWGDETYILCH